MKSKKLRGYFCIESDFLNGLDGHGFNELSDSEQMLYLRCWNFLWSNGKHDYLSDKYPTNIQRMVGKSYRYVAKWMINIQNLALVEYFDFEGKGYYKFNGLLDFHRKMFPKSEMSSTYYLKRNIKLNLNLKEEEENLDQENKKKERQNEVGRQDSKDAENLTWDGKPIKKHKYEGYFDRKETDG